MPHDERRYWFRAKRYGWGWGLPCAWQGWAVLAGYLLAILAPRFLWPDHPTLPLAIVVVATPLLLAVCLLKGEPARWRWGGK